MNFRISVLALIGGFALALKGESGFSQTPTPTAGKVEVMLLGFDHLGQLYNGQPQSDVFSPKKQAEISHLNDQLQKFAPDMILVELEPKEQVHTDSLYRLYQSGKRSLNALEDGRSETYQIGFSLAKRLNHARIYDVDHYEATSQSLLSKGENIAVFQQGLKKLQNTARPLKSKVQHDSLSIDQYISIMNQPEFIALSHRLLFNLPALVINGDFSETGTNTVDIGKIDKRYIGAEFISLFYNRNLKIYSNLLNAQMKNNGKRLLVIFGQAHIGVLQDLIEHNPDYTLISPSVYLK